MTPAATPEADAPCPDAVEAMPAAGPLGEPDRRLVAVRRPFESIAPATWDRLAAATPWATPFSRWAVHRAWWDGYGVNAHDETVVVTDPAAADPDELVAIVPLMHRHAVEPDDAINRTRMRAAGGAELTPVAPTAKAVYFGASYHADYATVLAAPGRLPAVASALVDTLAEPASGHPDPWDAVDLRRLRCADPAGGVLADALAAEAPARGWAVMREREDVCPVLVLGAGCDFDAYLGTLGKKERHEIRRKIRRAEAAGAVRLERSPDPIADLDAFIDLHQRRWGEAGLFPPTPGGDQSRVFFRRLFELTGGSDLLQLQFLSVGGRRIAAGIWFDDGATLYFYNAGVDPDARDLSPGILLVARSIEGALAAGRRRFDFLRGNEAYKYGWGAVDEPIQRLLVVRLAA
jgi:CelD/BcsL family acetyltransferase involved in cellulose biosynthesis